MPSFYLQLIEVVARRRSTLLKEADHLWAERVQKFNKEEGAATGTLSQLQKCLKEVTASKERNNFVLLMQRGPKACQTFESFLGSDEAASHWPPLSLSSPAAHIEWGRSWAENVIADLDRMGKIEPGGTGTGSPRGRRTSIIGHTVASGDGLQEAVMDQPCLFILTTYGADGRRCKESDGETFNVKIQGLGSDFPAMVTDRGDGTYVVDYTPSIKREVRESLLDRARQADDGLSILFSTSTPTTSSSIGRLSGSDALTLSHNPTGFVGGKSLYLTVTVTSSRDDEHRCSVGKEDGRHSDTDRESEGEEDAQRKGVIGSPFRVRLYNSFQGNHLGAMGQRGREPSEFNGPGSIAVNGDMLWIGDGDNHR